jgi:hypothetical protein
MESKAMTAARSRYRRVVSLESLFVVVAGMPLLLTGAAKLASVGGEARILDQADPLLMLSNRQLMAAVGLIEMVLAGYLWFGREREWQLGMVAWLASSFLLYRLGLWWLGVNKPCGCLGNAANWWPWLARHQEALLKATLAFLLVGSAGFICARLAGRNGATAGSTTPAPGDERVATDP